MREIIFRGKSVDNGKWNEGYFCPCCFGHFPCSPAIVSKDEIEKGCWRPEEVDPKTIGQYTGLKDKNGKRIFEGDIVINKHPRRLSNKPFVVEYKPIVGGYGYWRMDIHDQLEVIGNIHDNPELLEV